MIQDILGRLKTLRLNIINSPDFNTYSTQKAKLLIDDVLKVFIRVNQKSTSKYNLDGNISSNIVNKFGLNGNHTIKNKLQIMNQLNSTKTMIRVSPELSSDMRKYCINKIEMIKKL